jgi:hypothetical protein
MEARLIEQEVIKKYNTRIKLTKKESTNSRIIKKLEELKAIKTKESSRFIYFEVKGNCLPIIL